MIFTIQFLEFITTIRFLIWLYTNLAINKSLEVCFYYTILIFSLAISLQVESYKKLALNTKKMIE